MKNRFENWAKKKKKEISLRKILKNQTKKKLKPNKTKIEEIEFDSSLVGRLVE